MRPDPAECRRQPACSNLPDPDDELSAVLMPPMARFVLRGDAAAIELAGAAIRLPLPARPLTSATMAGLGTLWLGPDEWLLIADAEARGRLASALAEALGSATHSLVDVSHRQVAFSVQGRLAARVLSSGCPLDLSSKSFPTGMVTRTLFHKAEVVIWRRPDGFHLEVTRSFAPYVAGHLACARTSAAGLPEAALP